MFTKAVSIAQGMEASSVNERNAIGSTPTSVFDVFASAQYPSQSTEFPEEEKIEVAVRTRLKEINRKIKEFMQRQHTSGNKMQNFKNDMFSALCIKAG